MALSGTNTPSSAAVPIVKLPVPTGAPIAIATALVVETVSLALVARHKLGFNVFIWGKRA